MEHYISIYAYTYILYTHHPSSERNCATSAKKPPKTKDSPRQKKPSYLNHAPHLKELLTPHRLKERESANSACRDEALAKAGPKIVKKSTKNTKNAQEMTKSARFLQKKHKKLQKIHLFLPHLRPKPTTLRQTQNFIRHSFSEGGPIPDPCGHQKNLLEKAAIQIKVSTLSHNTNFICLITKSYEKQATAKALNATQEPISLESRHRICYNTNNLTKENPAEVRSGDEQENKNSL